MKRWKQSVFVALTCTVLLGTFVCVRFSSGVANLPAGMVLIPGGTNEGTDPDFGEYSFTVDSFYMDKYPVTKALWDEVYSWANANSYWFCYRGFGKGTNHPVNRINWYDAVKWCNARSEMEGRPAVYTVNGSVYRSGRHDDVVQRSVVGYRLPTSDEWEYAARGGLSGKRFPWGNTINHSNANYRANGSAYSYDTSPYSTFTYHPTYHTGSMTFTSPVGAFAANDYGLYDMAGNVDEWNFNWHPTYVGSYRVIRGGCFGINAYHCQVGRRNGFEPDGAGYSVGFRAVLPKGR